MKSIVKLCLGIALALVSITQFANAQSAPKAEVLAYGIFSKDYKLIEQTDTVVAKIGTKFGFTYRITGAPKDKPIELRVVFKFPPKGIKDEQNDDLFEMETKINAPVERMAYQGFQFERKGELVPGEWIIGIYAGETKLAERKFNVVLK